MAMVGRLCPCGQVLSTVRGVVIDARAVDEQSKSVDSALAPHVSVFSSIDDLATQIACATISPMLECRCVESLSNNGSIEKNAGQTCKSLTRAIRSKSLKADSQIVVSNILCTDVRTILHELPKPFEILDTEEEMAKTRFLNAFCKGDASMRFQARLERACEQTREIRALLREVLVASGVESDLKSETRKGKGTEPHTKETYDPEFAWANVMTAPRVFAKKAVDSQLVQRLIESDNGEIGGRGLALSAVLYQIGRQGLAEREMEQDWWTSDFRSPH